jgi:16S rRNA C967 or C1407 C5-methylase (RsmB/RsmF family)
MSCRDFWKGRLLGEPPPSADGSGRTLLLTPLDHSTDGFFVATLVRSK